jgi:hypothetical protein
MTTRSVLPYQRGVQGHFRLVTNCQPCPCGHYAGEIHMYLRNRMHGGVSRAAVALPSRGSFGMWVVRIEHRSGAFAVGLVLAARMLPSLLFGLASGTIADRVGERNADWIVRVSDHLTGGTAVDRCFCSQLDQNAKCELFH